MLQYFVDVFLLTEDIQEAPLPHRERATRYVSKNRVNCCNAVSKIGFEMASNSWITLEVNQESEIERFDRRYITSYQWFVIIIIIIFVYLIADITRNYYSNNIRHAGRDTTAATQGSTIYRRVKPAKLLPHTAHGDWINRTGLTSWTFTRWCDRHTSDKVAHYSIYRPRKDERLSWPWVAGYIPK